MIQGITNQGVAQRRLGAQGLVVTAIGLGCAGLSSGYGASDDKESLTLLKRACDLGVTFFDTANIYGNGHNEELLGRAIGARREEVVIATKFGFVRNGDGSLRVDAQPARIREECAASLRRLGTDIIDVYYPHRIDPNIPIEDTVGAMAELVHEGMVRHLGLCEASAPILERASAVHPISVLESEWSLWTRDLETDVLATARKLGIGIVPYCPLGRGFLTGTIMSTDVLGPDDYRRTSPRFAHDNLARNLLVVNDIQAMAKDKGCTAAQLCLAWILAQGDDVVPIPGTRRLHYLEENLASATIELTTEDLDRLEMIAPFGVASGARYAENQPSTPTTVV